MKWVIMRDFDGQDIKYMLMWGKHTGYWSREMKPECKTSDWHFANELLDTLSHNGMSVSLIEVGHSNEKDS